VLAQRLARRLCPVCKKPYEADESEMEMLGLAATGGTKPPAPPETRTLFRAVGCDACKQTGYRGRTGLYELLVVDETIRALVHRSGNEQEIRERAVDSGMLLLRDDGMARVLEGETTLDEVLRVTREG
jgi:general secretion pathway protein E